MALTERQQQIKKLLDQGKTPREVGEALGISENAVYQHRRRMGANKSSSSRSRTASKPAAAKKSSAAKKSTQTRSRSRSRSTARPQLAAVPTGRTAEPEPMDPLTAVRQRREAVNTLIEGAKTEAEEARQAAEKADKAYSEALAKVKPELDKLDAAEAVLTGKLKPPTRQPRKPAETPAPTPPPPAAEATPEPTPEPEAEAQDAAAEAPDEPTEVAASDNGGDPEPEMERAGVPTVPEFRQEDAFAS